MPKLNSVRKCSILAQMMELPQKFQQSRILLQPEPRMSASTRDWATRNLEQAVKDAELVESKYISSPLHSLLYLLMQKLGTLGIFFS